MEQAADIRSGERDVSLELVRDAHPCTSDGMNLLANQKPDLLVKNTLKKIFTPLEQERPLQTTVVLIKRFFEHIDFQPGGHSKSGLLRIGCVDIVTHPRASMP
jgi:hypothetical protein